MAAVTHSDDAVVIPKILSLDCSIVPAPINPIPATTYDAIRLGSLPGKASTESTVNKQEPKHTKMCVRRPAGLY